MMISQLKRPTLPSATKTTSATTAMTMPVADRRLPVRAVAGEFIRCSPTTKSAAPTMKDNWTRYPTFAAFIAISPSLRGRVGCGRRAAA